MRQQKRSYLKLCLSKLKKMFRVKVKRCIRYLKLNKNDIENVYLKVCSNEISVERSSLNPYSIRQTHFNFHYYIRMITKLTDFTFLFLFLSKHTSSSAHTLSNIMVLDLWSLTQAIPAAHFLERDPHLREGPSFWRETRHEEGWMQFLDDDSGWGQKLKCAVFSLWRQLSSTALLLTTTPPSKEIWNVITDKWQFETWLLSMFLVTETLLCWEDLVLYYLAEGPQTLWLTFLVWGSGSNTSSYLIVLLRTLK